MAVKWIGDAARELGIDVMLAIEVLASKQNYPYNGLLDEERFQLLKHHLPSSSAGTVSVLPVPPEAKGGKKDAGKGKKDRDEITSVTSPIPQMPDKAEERTVIIPPPLPER